MSICVLYRRDPYSFVLQRPLPIYTFYLFTNRRLPRSSKWDFPFIQPWLNAFLDQLLRDLADGRLVVTVVAQEYIKDFRFGVLSVHTEAIL